jgi:DNA-binding MurR/RpiR family transcriptional regulator
MLKIFTTQLVGYFNMIQEKEEMNIEDCSRTIASAIIGDGAVYFHGYNEMMAVCYEAVLGQEPLPKSSFLYENGEKATLSKLDRVIIAAPSADHKDAIALAKEAKAEGATVIGLSVDFPDLPESLASVCDFHMNTQLHSPLVPTDSGEKIGTPTAMTGLYSYYALYLTTKEILADYM